MVGLGSPLIDALEEPLHCHSTHSDARLVDTGQRDMPECCHRGVVVAQQGDVFWNGKARLLEGIEGADGAQIVGGKDRGRQWSLAE